MLKYLRVKRIRRPRKFLTDVYGLLRLRLERELWRDLEPMMARSSSTGCKFHVLYALFRYVVLHQPKHVLELGAGISTVVLAHAAKKVRKMGLPCTIISMEESPFYYEELKKLFPASVSDCVELIQSPTEDRKIGDRIARCYTRKPGHAYDFVFIDGPQVPRDAHCFDGDIIDVVTWNARAFTAYLEKRAGTRVNLVRLFPWAEMSRDLHNLARFDFPDKADRH